MSATYGNTLTTTLWRVVEYSLDPTFGLITAHPHRITGDAEADIRYFIRSPGFAQQFTRVPAEALFGDVRQRCHGRRGPLGNGAFAVPDDRGQPHEFHFETFFNGHDALALGTRTAPTLTRPVPR